MIIVDGMSTQAGKTVAIGRSVSVPVSWRTELRAPFLLAVPIVLTQLAQIALQTTDTIMMGWLGPRALAAGSLATSIYMSTFLFGLGILASVAPVASNSRLVLRQWRAL